MSVRGDITVPMVQMPPSLAAQDVNAHIRLIALREDLDHERERKLKLLHSLAKELDAERKPLRVDVEIDRPWVEPKVVDAGVRLPWDLD